MIPFRQLIEHTITKANIKIDFKVSYTKMGTMANLKNSKREERFSEMEKYYDEQERLKEEEKMKRRKVLIDDGDFSEYELSDDGNEPKSIIKTKSKTEKKEKKLMKTKFGNQFLDVFRKSMYDAISKSSQGNEEQIFNKLIKDNKIPPEVARLLNHNFNRPQNIKNNANFENVYQFNQHSSNQDIKGVESTGYLTLQGSGDPYRRGTQKYSPRRVLRNVGQPQKIWSTGRPRGSLERFSGNMRKRFYYVEPQSLYVGVQGISLQRHHRVPGTADVNRSTEKYYEPKNIIELDKSIDDKQLLNAIEKVSRKFGTPFQISGHREEFFRHVQGDRSLQERIINIDSKTKSKPISTLMSKDMTNQNIFAFNDHHNLSVKESYVTNFSSPGQEVQLPNK